MKPAAVIATAVLCGLIIAPAAAETWQGRRGSWQASSNGIACSPTRIVLDRNGRKRRGRLTYNDAGLSGTISAGGRIRMTAATGRFRYEFSGATRSRMSGTWRETLSGCGGTWSVTPK